MTTLTLSAQPFDPGAASADERLAVGRLLAASHAHAFPDDPPLIPEREAASLTHLSPGEQADHFVVWDGPQAVARAALFYDLKQNTHLAHATISVHPRLRRRGLGRALAAELEAVARREGRRVITFGTTSRNADGEAFARHLNAEAALPMKVSRLELASVDDALITRWQQRPAGDPYRLRAWTVIPDEYLERAAQMMMVMNTAPKGDLDMQDWQITPEMVRAWEEMVRDSGELRFLLAAEDTRTGELAGYTETFWSPERAPLVYQGATGVIPSARGQGLGKWLKAAMLEHLRQHAPGARWIRTSNADVNEAMLSINVAMGFQSWASFTEWQIKLDQSGK